MMPPLKFLLYGPNMTGKERSQPKEDGTHIIALHDRVSSFPSFYSKECGLCAILKTEDLLITQCLFFSMERFI